MISRKFIFPLVVLLTFFCSSGDVMARYYVHKVSGQVSVVKEGAYVPMERGRQVNLNDKVRVGDRSSVSIVDKNTNRVYVGGEAGLTSVANIIMSARKQSESISRLVYNQAVASIKDDGRPSISLGATSRGDESGKSTTQLLYSSLAGLKDCRKIEHSSSISLSRIKNGDEWFFRVDNKGSELLYFGIIRLKDGKPEQVLEVGRFDGVSVLAVEAGASVELSQFTFVSTRKRVSYLLFASTSVFDTQELSVLFKSGQASSEENVSVPLLYTLSE